jgi:hypothetical protein
MPTCPVKTGASSNGKLRGKMSAEIDLTETRERSPRYNFIVSQHVYDTCIPSGDALNYEIVVVDNSTGAEVSSIKGGGCLIVLGDEIAKAIREL